MNYDDAPTTEFEPASSGSDVPRNSAPEPTYEQLRQMFVEVRNERNSIAQDNQVLAGELEDRISHKRKLTYAIIIIAVLLGITVGASLWGYKEHSTARDAMSRAASVDTNQRQSVQKVSDLQRSLQSAEGERDSMKKDLDRVKGELSRVKTDTSKQISVLEDTNNKLRSENSKLSDEASSSTQARDSMAAELETLRQKVQELQRKSDDDERYISELEDYATSLENNN